MKPFMKWVGGKSQLLPVLREKVPEKYGTYYEPFIGCGALLLDIQPEIAVIGDVNRQLLNVWHQIKEDPEKIITVIDFIDRYPADKEKYLGIRNDYNKTIAAERFSFVTAAYTIWLNKHCFNGLYRVNSQGAFNVPWNNDIGKTSLDIQNLLEISRYLQKVDIRTGDYEITCRDTEPADFIYCDPPYAPVSKTADFTNYNSIGFGWSEQERLAAFVRNKDYCYVMVSNNDTPEIRRLYEGFNIQSVSARRSVNSVGTARTGQEVIITNY